MVHQCYVPGCKTLYTKDSEIKFHQLPRDLLLKTKWLNAFKRRTAPTKSSVVCSKHFKESDYRESNTGLTKTLKKNSVPTCNLPVQECDHNMKSRKTKTISSKKRKTKVEVDNLSKEAFLVEDEISIDLEDILEYELVPVKKLSTAKTNTTPVQVADVRTQTEEILYNEIGLPCSETQMKVDGCNETQIWRKPRIRSEMCEDNMSEERFGYFTGFSKERFNILFQSFYLKSNPFDNILSARDQLTLTLIKYKHAIDFMLIGELYGVPRKKVLSIFTFWTKEMYKYFSSINFWNLRHQGRTEYTAVIDCVEIPTFKNFKDTKRSKELFSSLTNKCTFKYLVATDEKGLVIFCSQAYGGSRSERYLFTNSNFLGRLSEGDIILSRKWFDIDDLLENKKISMKISAFEIASEFDSKQIKNRRILVSNVKRLSTEHKILRETLPKCLWPNVTEIIFNANMLSNFKSCVL